MEHIIKDVLGRPSFDVTVIVDADGFVRLRGHDGSIVLVKREAEELITFIDLALGDNE